MPPAANDADCALTGPCGSYQSADDATPRQKTMPCRMYQPMPASLPRGAC